MKRLCSRVDDDLSQYIQTRTEGNPFFTEQFCLNLQASDAIVFCEDRYRIHSKPEDIPADINMILTARIDRLSAELKEIVKVASVLGREFDVQVLKTLTGLLKKNAGAETQQKTRHSEISSLIRLAENELIWSQLTGTRYMFNSALLRDSAYYMQLRTRLRGIHKLAGDAISSCYPGVETVFADCAFHYQQVEDWKKAAEYCTCAGEDFMESVRYDDALVYSEKALSIFLEFFEKNHSVTADAYSSVGRVCHEKGEFERELLCHQKALAIRKSNVGETRPSIATSYSNIGSVHYCRKENDMALIFYRRALSIQVDQQGEKHSDTALLYYCLGLVSSDSDDLTGALEYFEKALAVQKELLGAEHPHTVLCMKSIADVIERIGRAPCL